MQDLWICLICGHVGCGRGTAKHAVDHWQQSGHCYSLELESQRVSTVMSVVLSTVSMLRLVLQPSHVVLHNARMGYDISMRRVRCAWVSAYLYAKRYEHTQHNHNKAVVQGSNALLLIAMSAKQMAPCGHPSIKRVGRSCNAVLVLKRLVSSSCLLGWCRSM